MACSYSHKALDEYVNITSFYEKMVLRSQYHVIILSEVSPCLAST
jgi:hypothetical protein